MRITIGLSSEKGIIVLPKRHNHILQGFIYENIGNNAMRRFLHDWGFGTARGRFKMFTFSRILGDPVITTDFITYRQPVKLVVSSPIHPIIEALREHLAEHPDVWLQQNNLKVQDIRVEDPQVDRDVIDVKMLSPVTACTTNERGFVYYYNPNEPGFQDSILGNLAEKALLVTGKRAKADGFEVSPLALDDKDFKVIYFGDQFIKGYMGFFRLKGDRALLQAALDAGLGSKNSMGFGCFRLVA